MTDRWNYCPNCGVNLIDYAIITKQISQSWHPPLEKSIGDDIIIKADEWTYNDFSVIVHCNNCNTQYESELRDCPDDFQKVVFKNG